MRARWQTGGASGTGPGEGGRARGGRGSSAGACRGASPAEDVAAMSAVVLAHDDGEVGVAALAPEHRLVLHPARPLFALLRLLELFEGPAGAQMDESAGGTQGTRAPGAGGRGHAGPAAVGVPRACSRLAAGTWSGGVGGRAGAAEQAHAGRWAPSPQTHAPAVPDATRPPGGAGRGSLRTCGRCPGCPLPCLCCWLSGRAASPLVRCDEAISTQRKTKNQVPGVHEPRASGSIKMLLGLVADAALLATCLVLAVLVLLRQAGLLRGGARAGAGAPAPRTPARIPAAKAIRRQFGASLRESSMAVSLGVGRAGRGAGFASPLGAGRVSQRALTPSAGLGLPLAEQRFADLLKAITYLDDTVEASAFGFSVSSKRRPGPDDYPWVDTVLAHGPAESRLKPHERIVMINAEGTREWPAERVKRAVLASPHRLSLSVMPAGDGASRQEVLYRGRLGRVHVLCERCSDGEQCDTSRALLHFKELLEHAPSIDDLRETLTERTHDTLCPPKERAVFTKILAHALACSDGAEPPGGPAKSPTQDLSLSAASYKAGSALSMSMLDSHADSVKMTPKALVKLGSAPQGSASRAEPADAHNRRLLEDAVTAPAPAARALKLHARGAQGQ